MYKYFMGPKCNVYTKKKNEPTIIEAHKNISLQIDKWLDKYEIDLDHFIEAIQSITRFGVEKISIDDTQIYRIRLTGNRIAYIELFYSDVPKCRLRINKDEYVFYLKNTCMIESCMQVRGGIQFTANALEKKIHIGKKPVLLTIALDKFNGKFYDVVKKNVHKLKEWDNIANVICWIKSLPVKLSSYELEIISFDEEYIGCVKIVVKNQRIFKYVHVNPKGQFQVTADDKWKAEYNGYCFEYSGNGNVLNAKLPKYDLECFIEYPKNLEYVKELIGIMFGTLRMINSSLDEMEECNT